MKVLVSTKDMKREDWLRWRQAGIGGSEVAAIMGLSRWKTPVDIFNEKTTQVDNTPPSLAARCGIALEQTVADLFEETTGKKLEKLEAIVAHDDYPFMIANVDRIVVDEEAGFEAKTTSAFNKKAWENGAVPDEYVLQCNHYMAVTGFPRWYIACIIGNSEFVWTVIERDDELIAGMIALEKDFWDNNVSAGVPPDPFLQEESSKLPREAAGSILLPVEADSWIRQYYNGHDLEKQGKNLKEEASSHLKALLGTHEKGYLGKYLADWSTVVSNKFNQEAFKKEHPDLFKAYLKTDTTRRFTIREMNAQ